MGRKSTSRVISASGNLAADRAACPVEAKQVPIGGWAFMGLLALLLGAIGSLLGYVQIVRR